MAHSDHGIVKDKRAEDQPRDKQRAQTVHKTDSKGSPKHCELESMPPCPFETRAA